MRTKVFQCRPLTLVMIIMICHATAFSQTPTLSYSRQLDGYADLDKYVDVATDVNGNVYLAGWSKKTASEYNWEIFKYNSSGTRIWFREYDPGTIDTAVKMTVTGGYVYVTGRSKPGTYYAIATLKIDTTSGINATGWPEVYNPAYNCEVRAVKVGSAGDVFVAGTIFHSSTTGYA